MPKSSHWLIVVGTRPNFVKAAPLLRRLQDFPHLRYSLLHTNQHYDKQMADVFFQQLGIEKPHVVLPPNKGLPSEKLGLLIHAFQAHIHKNKYDGVIVFGDVFSSVAAALAASAQNVPLVHVEAGLRSHDHRMPEELNRVIIDHLSERLFTTEPSADENLRKEKISVKKIIRAGNIMIESLKIFQPQFQSSPILSQLGVKRKKYLVATLHRQENIDNPVIARQLLATLIALSQQFQIILPLHPRTRDKFRDSLASLSNNGFRIIDPLGYFDFNKLVKESLGVVTDSGGIQEETSIHGVACCTLRDSTERPITIHKGTNELFPIADLDIDKIVLHLKTKHTKAKIDMWDDQVSLRICQELPNVIKK